MTARWRRATLALTACACWGGMGCSRDGDPALRGDAGADAPATTVAGALVFDTSRVATLALEVSDDALATLRADAKLPMNTEDFTYVPARLTFDGTVYEQVGLRVKGNSSRVMAVGDAVPFKLDTNRYVPGQRLDGLTKVNLHNNVNQPAAMNEYLSYGAFRDSGVAASRTGWADVSLNGQSLGLYTTVEQVDARMLGRWYDDGDADLYKPEPPAGSLNYAGDAIGDYTNVSYEADNATDHATFLNMVKAIAEADASTWNDVVDVDSVLVYLAGNVALGNWDTYVAMNHNFYLFEAAPGKLTMLPWDMNLSQGATTAVCPAELRMGAPGTGGFPPGGGGLPPGGGAFPAPPSGFPGGPGGGFPPAGDGGMPPGFPGGGFPGVNGAPLHDGLMASEAHFSRYLEVLRRFLDGPGSADMLDARIDAVVDVLGDRITGEGVTDLRNAISSRVTALEAALQTTTTCPLASP